MAEMLGMSPDECERRHTERQLSLWLTWKAERDKKQIERPTDPLFVWLQFLVMETRRSWVAKPNDVQMSDIRLSFEPVKKSDYKPTPEHYQQMGLASKLLTMSPDQMDEYLAEHNPDMLPKSIRERIAVGMSPKEARRSVLTGARVRTASKVTSRG